MPLLPAKRDVLDRLVAKTEERIAELREDLALEQRLLERLKAEYGPKSKPMVTNGATGTSVARATKVEQGSLTDHIAALFRERPRVLRASEIAKELESRGVTTSSKNGLLPMVLSSLSRRSDIFGKAERGRYYLLKKKKESLEMDEPASDD